MKNIFRKRTEDEVDRMKDEGVRFLIDIIRLLAFNVISTWAAVRIVLIIFGPQTLTALGREEIRASLDVHYILAYVFILICSALYVLARRGQFTYGDPVEKWNAEKKTLYLRNLAAYVVVNIPVSLYFIIADIAYVYRNANTTSGQTGIAKMNTAEALWVANFFAPQATFYRLTRNLLLGILLNIAIYAGVTAIVYLVIKMKPPKQTNIYRAPVVDNENKNDDMNAVD